ncbi:MAG: NAD(P)(+) transhydrogenase (Re/Si-specific) subunit beta [Gammaproteobacteria bacterium]|nr:NAD(P)(+) transhydrogenase (Re/Si-specific) subunit beta [Gammaproteobacteria bacterium]
MSDIYINLAYVVAAALFIFGLKMLGSPASARRGNLLSSVGMLIAIVVTLLAHSIIEFQYIVISAVVGGVIGAFAARAVASRQPASGSVNMKMLAVPARSYS